MAYNQMQSRGAIYLLIAVAIWQGVFLLLRWKMQTKASESVVDWRQQMQHHFETHPTDSFFYFDPNTATIEDWEALGLSVKQARLAVRDLRRKPIQRKAQLKEVFVIDSAFYERVAPYIMLKQQQEGRGNNDEWDPNTATIEELQERGLHPPTAARFVAYRDRIGGFTKKEELKKVYGVSDRWYKEQSASIVIHPLESEFLETDSTFEITQTDSIWYEINELDSAGWTQLRGIGSVFASRIVKYRERLGGFYCKTQLLEVYGMDSTRVVAFWEQLQVDSSAIQQLNINIASEKELSLHPYITKSMAREMVQFRNSYRTFGSVAELKNFSFMDGDLFRKIAPYLKTEN
ncbi:MAG: helix-hairpin-helix domain-containing protein [Schleiferiaceae bacterium]|nr:helix-hairpin-helix domain-containing protein [Schleiferiaceae bacterium]